ncbi:MAG: slipin family protein [Chromatiales bacterium]|nr:slipin family protein [Chromatiales bacterium]
MLLVKKVDVADNERAFLFKNNRFVDVLEPGRYSYFDFLSTVKAERFDITERELDHKLGKLLVGAYFEQTNKHLQAIQLSDYEVGLLYADGQLVDIVAPGNFKIYWKGVEKIDLRRVDISDNFSVPEQLLGLLGRSHNAKLQRSAGQAIYYTEVEDNHLGVLVVNGKIETLLQPGNYGFWRYNRSVAVKHIDLRLQNIEVTGQEILTKDRVSLRLNLSATYRVEDPEQALSKLADFNDYLYREFQLQLRQVVGTQTLDELLKNKDAINQMMIDGIRSKVAEYGISVKSVGLRDIILPGDMKTILNQVVEAEKSAEANLIKRREETAATRSLHNTAKMMEGSPTLMRLKELEVLEKVTERIGNINVYSGLEGVMKDLIKVP